MDILSSLTKEIQTPNTSVDDDDEDDDLSNPTQLYIK